MNEPRYRRNRVLLEAQLEGELLTLDPKQGQCFSFNTTATSVWQLLEHPKDFTQIRDALMSEYDVGADDCDADLTELLAELERLGLVDS